VLAIILKVQLHKDKVWKTSAQTVT